MSAFLLKSGSGFVKLLLGLQKELSGPDGRGTGDSALSGLGSVFRIRQVKGQDCPMGWMSLPHQ